MAIELWERDKVDEVMTVVEIAFEVDVLYLVHGKRKGPCSLSKLW